MMNHSQQSPVLDSPRDIDLARWIEPNDFIVWGQGAAEPTELVTTLLAQAASIPGLRAFIGMTFSRTLDLTARPPLLLQSYCGTGANQTLVKRGWLDIWPGPYSTLPRYLAERIDVLLLAVSPPNAQGEMSLGLAHEYLLPLIDHARVIIAEINPATPFTYGTRRLHVDECAALVESTGAPPELHSRTATEAEQRIATQIAAMIEDGSTLQTGIGSLPDAILTSLVNHRDLGLHSGMATEGCMALMQKGAMTNARKYFDKDIAVAGMAVGSSQFYRFLHNNPGFAFRGTSDTHDSARIATLDRFVAINSALEVDLTGQINAEEIDGRYLGAVGGASDFLRAAARSWGGLPIIALPATSVHNGSHRSRIVNRLSGPVSTSRADAGIIVTEHGTADLRGKSLRERHAAMLTIAAPEFQAALDTTPPMEST